MSQPSPYSDEARVERAQQPPEPARPYDASTLAQFRARRANLVHNLSGPISRLLATVDAVEAERDKARALAEQFMDEASTARVNMFQAEQEARQAEAERDALRAAITRYLKARDAARPADEQAARDEIERLLGSEGGR